MEKCIHELKAGFVYLCVCVCEREREREKINCFEITVFTFSKDLWNVNFLFKKDFKCAELISKMPSFLYFRDRPKMAEEVKETS